MTLPGVPKPTVTTQKTTSKPVKDLAIGDRIPAVRTVTGKDETADGWVITFDDGSRETYHRKSAPAMTVITP